MDRRQSRVADDGFTLIEVMVALTILVVVATLAATTLLSVLRSTGNDRARVAAANLAAREIETVRSAFESPLQGPQSLPLGQVINAAPLPGAAAGSPLVVDNRAYTVTRTSEWQKQGASTGPCDGGSSGQLAYLQVGVKVTWADIGSTTPVTSATLLTPPLGTYNTGSGHIKAKVTDQNSAPEPGTTVTVANSSGGAVGSQLTAADGCAFFAFLAPGTYTVTASRAGYVDLNWQATPSQSITVVANQAVPAPFDNYAPAATTVFAFDTSQPLFTPAATTALTVRNPKIALTTASFPNSVPTRTLTTWPYADGLNAWSGDCIDADPAATGSTRPNPSPTTAGQTTNAVVGGADVAVRVTRSGAALVGATVEAVHANTGCPSPVTDPYDNRTTVGEVLRLPLTTDSTGTARALLPYGTWTLKVLGLSPASTWSAVTLASNASYPTTINLAVQ